MVVVGGLFSGSTAATSADSASGFGVLWQQHVVGAVTAQPVRIGTTLVVATNADEVYGLGTDGGSVLWNRHLGQPEPAGLGLPIDCANVAPQLGVLSTPAVDEAHGIVYAVSREWDGRSAATAAWRTHALNATDGREMPGWPVTLTGLADNAPGTPFDPVHSLQRAGIMLLDGHLMVAFAGICDRQPYRGWLVSLNSTTRKQVLWTDEPTGLSAAAGPGGGFGRADAHRSATIRTNSWWKVATARAH